MPMNFANGQFHTRDHVNVAEHVRQSRTGTAVTPAVPTVGQFLMSPAPTFTTPQAFNPGHLLPPQDITGAPHPMTATARSAVWSQFAANVGRWYDGFHGGAMKTIAVGPTYGDSSHPGLPYA
jgi:hypothetical protein